MSTKALVMRIMTIDSLLYHHHHPAVLHSDSDPGTLVDLSRGVFHSRLKPSFPRSLSLHSYLSLAQAHVLEFDHSVFGGHWQW